MKNFIKNSVLIYIVCVISVNFTPMEAQEKATKIDEIMSTYYEYGQFNGTVLVAENGNVIFKKGYGLANMEWNIPNTPDVKFRLGSITKQFTSMIIMQLVKEGKVSLEEKMTTYLPYYRKDTGDKVTIHHLLTHTSGIPSYTNLPNFFEDISRDPYPVKEFVKIYCSGDFEFEPGTQFKYNNSGYFLLGAVIEEITGKSYEDNLRERILEPLGMKDTGYDHHNTILLKRAGAYQKAGGGYENAPYLDMGLPYAAGSLYSTVEDLYIWDQALYTEKLLPEKYKEIMFTPFKARYAYGWIISSAPHGKKAIVHGGGINGFSTQIVRLVDDRHLIVLLNNTGGAPLNDMSLKIGAILYGDEYSMPKKSIADVLYDTVLNKGIKAAIKQYHRIKENEAHEYIITEGQINILGYRLLGADKIDEAIEIFRFNSELNPDSFNCYDSLGEAYMIKGEKDLAIKNYAKSLELNPENIGAVLKLQELVEK